MLKTITTSEFFDTVKLNPGKVVFVDTEGESFYINTSLVQYRQEGINYIVTIASDDEMRRHSELWEGLYLCFWNAPYDYGAMRTSVGKVDDLLVAFRIAFPNLDASLDKAVKYLKLYHLYDSINKKEKQTKGFTRGAYLSQSQLQYANDDVEALELIYSNPHIQKVLTTNKAYKLAMLAMEESSVWQRNGLPVREEVLWGFLDREKSKEARLEEACNGINARSYKQVQKALGIVSTSKETLTRIVLEGTLTNYLKGMKAKPVLCPGEEVKHFTDEKRHLAESILLSRKNKNTISKLNGYRYPRVYGFFSPVGAASTSRFSCKGAEGLPYVNLQNYPKEYKSIFGLPEGSEATIITADFATLEIRIACAIMGEPNMYKVLKEGLDVHTYVASLVNGCDMKYVTKEMRNNAKPINFGFLYGMSAQVFVEYAYDLYGIKFTLEEATIVRKLYFDTFPGFKRYHDNILRKLNKGGLTLYTALGYAMRPARYTDATNCATQGTGGEIMRLTIHRLVQWDKRILKLITHSIHDSLYIIEPDPTRVEEDKKALAEAMVDAWRTVSKSSLFIYKDIPMPVEVFTGKHLGELD